MAWKPSHHLLKRGKLPITRIVDQHIQSPESAHRQLHGRPSPLTHRALPASPASPARHICAHQRCQLLRPTRSSYDAVACGQRRSGDVPPQPVSASVINQTFVIATSSILLEIDPTPASWRWSTF